MDDDRRAIRIGAVVLVAIAIAAAALLVIDGLELRRHITVHAYYAHLGQLKEGAAVQVAGKQIGYVKRVRLEPARPGADDPLGGAGGVVLDLRIEARYRDRVPHNGEFFIDSKGIMAERYLEIGPPADGSIAGAPVDDGAKVRGTDPPYLDRLAAIGMNNVNAARELAAHVGPEWDAFVGAIRELSDTLAAIEPAPDAYRTSWQAQVALYHEAIATRDALRDSGTDADDIRGVATRARITLEASRAELRVTLARIDLLAAELGRIRGQLAPERVAGFTLALDRARDLLARTEAVVAAGAELAAMVERGEGTIGGFLTDDELADYAKEMNKVMKRQPWKIIGHPPSER